jgi:hypothetical protein
MALSEQDRFERIGAWMELMLDSVGNSGEERADQLCAMEDILTAVVLAHVDVSTNAKPHEWSPAQSKRFGAYVKRIADAAADRGRHLNAVPHQVKVARATPKAERFKVV